MFGSIITFAAQLPEAPLNTIDLWNRTGSTLSPGDVVALDLTGSATEVETYDAWDSSTDRDSVHPFRNVITLAAAHDDGWPIRVALETIADNAMGKFALSGVINVKVATGLSAGARLSPSSATATSLVAEADGLATVGYLLTGNASGAIAARPVIFNSMAAMFGPQSEV